jgi:hypothetical protein
MKIFEVTEPKSSVFYHVTFKSRLKSIMKNGITSGHKRNWNNRFGSKLGSTRLIYLFSDYTSAVRWAARMEWDFRDQGNPEIVIVRIQFTGYGRRDEHWENDGSWWTTVDPIPPDQIIDVIPLTLEMKQEVAQTQKATPPALSEGKSYDLPVKQYSVATRETTKDVKIYENPTKLDMVSICGRHFAMHGDSNLRGFFYEGNSFVWAAEEATHTCIQVAMGLEEVGKYVFYNSPEVANFHVRGYGWQEGEIKSDRNTIIPISTNEAERLRPLARRWACKITVGDGYY